VYDGVSPSMGIGATSDYTVNVDYVAAGSAGLP